MTTENTLDRRTMLTITGVASSMLVSPTVATAAAQPRAANASADPVVELAARYNVLSIAWVKSGGPAHEGDEESGRLQDELLETRATTIAGVTAKLAALLPELLRAAAPGEGDWREHNLYRSIFADLDALAPAPRRSIVTLSPSRVERSRSSAMVLASFVGVTRGRLVAWRC